MKTKNLLIYGLVFILTFAAGFLGFTYYQNESTKKPKESAKAQDSVTIELKKENSNEYLDYLTEEK